MNRMARTGLRGEINLQRPQEYHKENKTNQYENCAFVVFPVDLKIFAIGVCNYYNKDYKKDRGKN